MTSLKSLIFKTYYSLQFFYKGLFIKRKKSINPKVIDVLCRGESIKLYGKIGNRNNVDLVILANFENNDIYKSNIANNIIEKPVTIVANISEPIPKLSNLKLIHLDEVFISRMSRIDNIQYLKRNNFRLNSITKNVKFIDEKFYSLYKNINRNSVSEWNTGLLGLFIACTKNPNSINLFGMDFFESEYYYGSVDYELSEIEKDERSIKMIKNFKKTFFALIDTFPNIQFIIYTKSKISTTSKNIKVNII